MKISNLRIEKREDQSYLTVDISTQFTPEYNKLWFSVPSQYEDWLTDDVYDAFLVAVLYPAMYYKEDIEISNERDALVKEINSLKVKLKSERQPQKKFLLHREIVELEKKLK